MPIETARHYLSYIWLQTPMVQSIAVVVASRETPFRIAIKVALEKSARCPNILPNAAGS